MPFFTVYAIDMPGMGWSDIVPGGSYEEPALRAPWLSSSPGSIWQASRSQASRWARRYLSPPRPSSETACGGSWPSIHTDYPGGVPRANRVASLYVGSARLPAIGSVVTRMENKPVLNLVLRGGFHDGNKLPDHYLSKLRRVGPRRGYPRVAREVFGNVPSKVAARALYRSVPTPVTLIYGEHDWSYVQEREANLALLPGRQSITLPDSGHFVALEQPDRVSAIIIDSSGS